MQYFILLSFIMTSFICQAQQTESALFQIFENHKVGFIDSTGKVVIQPTFLSAEEFSEGLSSARTNGTYGYIDKQGKYVIQPQFDYAISFSEGLAIVYQDGKPYFINKQGQKAFNINFPRLEKFENERAKVFTITGKVGFINKQGKLVIDTVYTSINEFAKGMAVVQGKNEPSKLHIKYRNNNNVGVIDTLGTLIVPYGKYDNIETYKNGYFKVGIPIEPWDTIDFTTRKTGFIDRQGKLIFALANKNHSWISGDFHCGLAKINLYKYWLAKENSNSYDSDRRYEGFINLKGELAINDTTYRSVKEFSDNRAFVENFNGENFIIDSKGTIIFKDSISRFIGDGFNKGVAIIKKDGKYGLIDTNANYLIKPVFEGIDKPGIIDGYIFFYEWNSVKVSRKDILYGIAKMDGSILMNPTMQKFDENGFKNGLLACQVNNKPTYINLEGKIIWQNPHTKTKIITNLNIDYMNRGYFYANSKPNKKDFGGFGSSTNSPKKIKSNEIFPAKSLSIVINTRLTDTIFEDRKGFAVYVANTSNSKINFGAQDSRLYMKVQAKNISGEWKDIEYFPSSWCGNSYHTLTLHPQYHWSFLTPVYEGDFKTKLRIALSYIDPTDKSDSDWDKKEITIYSNEYDGSVNPGQFWRKKDYFPQGIMDPYND